MSDADESNNSRDYEVGYGRPPKRHQFKKGRSGNPRGRAKGTKNLKTQIAEEMNEKIQITENGRRKTISKVRGIIKALCAKAMRGDPRASQVILALVERYNPNDEDAQKLPLDEVDLMILALHAGETKRAA